MSPPPAGTVTLSESDETRIARLEAARDDHRDQLKVLAPLVAQYAVLEERLGNLRGDLNDGFDALRTELAEMKRIQSERAKERRTMLIALFVAGIGLFGTFVATAVPLLKGNDPPAREQTR